MASADRSVVARLPPLSRFGRYDLLGRLAVGGMAEIYLAREQVPLDGGARHVVIKRVLGHVAQDPQFVEMFRDEARLAMQLRHSAIVHIYEFGQVEGSWFLAMEWVDGVALTKLIRTARSHGGIPAPIAVKITATVAEALHYAHHAVGNEGRPLGIVHRDVSPQNIMIAHEGAVKLLDFGIAKATVSHAKTGDGQVKGKFAYMSPRQCLGESIDGRADVFALGVCLWEALAGHPLFHRRTQYETMRAVIEEEPPDLRSLRPDVDVDLEAIVLCALAKDREQRFPSAGDLQIALERWLARREEVVPATRISGFLGELFSSLEGEVASVDSTPFGQSFQVLSGAPRPATPIPSEPPVIDAALVAPESTAKLPRGRVSRSRRPPMLLAVLTTLILLVLIIGGTWWTTSTPQATGAPETPRTASAPRAPSLQPAPEAEPAPVEHAPVEHAPVEHAEERAPEDRPLPAAVRPAMATLAAVRVESEPAGATIRIDGEERGITPLTLEVPPGRHDMTLELARHRAWTTTLQAESAPTSVHAKLELQPRPPTRTPMVAMRGMRPARAPSNSARAPSDPARAPSESAPRGRLSINTRPWSRVFLGGQRLGTTPIGDIEVPAGALRLRLVDRDGTEHYRVVRVSEDAHERAFFELNE